MIKSTIFTDNELKVIDKKIKNKKLSQTDSNYLYKFIRPKLKEISNLDAKSLLDKMEYNQKIISIENNIKKIILKSIDGVDSIVIYGSYVQNNYKDYNDMDILIVTNKKLYKKLRERYDKIHEIKKELGKHSIIADMQILDKKTLYKSYPHSPSLIYQLKDYKVIYGRLKIPDKIELYNANLHMKLDWSNIGDIKPEGIDIYRAFRNTLLVRLILNKIIDNKRLNQSLNDIVGKNLLEKLKNNQESNDERKIALNFLKKLSKKTRQEIIGGLWEKIEL